MATAFHLPTVLGDLFDFSTIPQGATAVKPFNQQKYLGTWYEIARFDYYFEKNLEQVTATYSLRPDGKIKVDNKGFNTKKQKWEQSIGKAVPAGDPAEAKLKVSFFGPIYSGYNVVALEGDYQYALVAGRNLSYLWLLSRTPTMPDDVKQRFIAKAKGIGYDTDKLVWVKQG